MLNDSSRLFRLVKPVNLAQDAKPQNSEYRHRFRSLDRTSVLCGCHSCFRNSQKNPQWVAEGSSLAAFFSILILLFERGLVKSSYICMPSKHRGILSNSDLSPAESFMVRSLAAVVGTWHSGCITGSGISSTGTCDSLCQVFHCLAIVPNIRVSVKSLDPSRNFKPGYL